MSCRGRGICGCGAPSCITVAWWDAFGLLWWLVAFEIVERDERPNARRDDTDWNDLVRVAARHDDRVDLDLEIG